MSFWKIAWRSLRQRALASSLTGLSMALGVALMILRDRDSPTSPSDQFENDAQGYHLIVGSVAKVGSPMQLVMSNVLSPGHGHSIRFSYRLLSANSLTVSLQAYTEAAVPYCLGDSYQCTAIATSTECVGYHA